MHTQVDTVVDDLRQLVDFAGKHSNDAAKVNSLIDEIVSNAQGLTDELKPVLGLRTRKLGDNKKTLELSDLDPVLGKINVTPPPDSSNLQSFLETVGSSLIKAQQSLNQQSQEYSQAAAAEFKGLVPPSQFLIPSVKAEMTVGLDQMQEHTLNLILIKDSVTRENYVQSKISFDLVAAPPPPGAVINLTPFMLLQGRLDFLAELERLPEVTQALAIPDAAHFGIVFAVPKSSTNGGKDDNVFLVVYVIQDAGKSVLDPVWKTIVLVAVQRVAGNLRLYNKLLEATDSNPLVFPKTKSDKVTSFGDALMQIVAAIYQWMASVGFPPEVP